MSESMVGKVVYMVEWSWMRNTPRHIDARLVDGHFGKNEHDTSDDTLSFFGCFGRERLDSVHLSEEAARQAIVERAKRRRYGGQRTEDAELVALAMSDPGHVFWRYIDYGPNRSGWKRERREAVRRQS